MEFLLFLHGLGVTVVRRWLVSRPNDRFESASRVRRGRSLPGHTHRVVAARWRWPGRSGQQGEKWEAKPLRSLILTLSLCSLPLASSPSGAVLAIAVAHLRRARTPQPQHHRQIHHAHSFATISSTSPTCQCHHPSQGKAALRVVVAAMATEHR